jgi:UDP-N-acetyl-D-mannosaminuronate dehydrogenase
VDVVRISVLGTGYLGVHQPQRTVDLAAALAVAHGVAGLGARVRVYDPGVARSALKALGLHSTVDVESACRAAELVMVLSDWAEFAQLDPWALGAVVTRRTVLDARLVLDPGARTRAGSRVGGLGRGDVGETAQNVPVSRTTATVDSDLGAAGVEAPPAGRRRAG